MFLNILILKPRVILCYLYVTTKDQMKNLIPGVVHNDGTARVQSVDEENKVFYKILTEFHKISGVPILINTSFNIGGEAIVNSIDDAIIHTFRWI